MAQNFVGEVGNLVQGVSQQTPRIRAVGQVEEQENCISSLAYGLSRRPGTEYSYDIPDNTTLQIDENTIIHHYTSGSAGYTILCDGSKIGVIDNNGVLQDIATTYTGASYTAGYIDPVLESGKKYSDYMGTYGTPDNTLTHTIADTTFICNQNKVPAMGTDLTYDGSTISLLYFKAVTYGKTYTVKHGSTIIHSVTLPDVKTIAAGDVLVGTVPSVRDVCLDFAKIIQASAVVGVQVIGDNVVYLGGTNAPDITIEDDNAGNDAIVIHTSVDRVEDLPYGIPEIDKYFIEIAGESTETADNFYLEPYGDSRAFVSTTLDYFSPETGAARTLIVNYAPTSNTIWRECPYYGDHRSIDPETMPLQIKEVETGKFIVSEPSWGARAAGNETTNKVPKFIGRRLNDIGSYQNRLVFLAGHYLIGSRTDEWFEFFKDTVAIANKANPCNIAAGGTQVGDSISDLKKLTYAGDDLIVFSSDMQYRIPGEFEFVNSSPLTPTAPYSADVGVRPVSTGRGLLFLYSTGQFMNAREYVLEGSNKLPTSINITSHIPSYITGSVKEMIHSTLFDITFIRTGNDTLYVYQAGKDAQGNYIQNAWHKWTFTDNVIRKMWISEGSLYLLTSTTVKTGDPNGSTTTVKEIVSSIPIDIKDVGYLHFRPNIDRIIETTATESGGVIVLPEDMGTDVRCILGAGSDAPGYTVQTEYTGGQLIISPEESIEAGTTLVLGIDYQSKVAPSTLYVRQTNGTPRTLNRTQLRRLFVHFTDTSAFTVTVTDKAGNEYISQYSSDTMDADGVWDEVILADGVHQAPVRGDNTSVTITISSTDHTPFSITSLKFRARYGRKVRG